MIVDASALLAIVFKEQEAVQFTDVISGSDRLRMSAANWLEAAMVVDRKPDVRVRRYFDEIVSKLRIQIEPVTAEHTSAARQAWREFGRGKHPAKLNFGDCLAYGFAKTAGEPLLFKGNGFSQTDIKPALKV